MSKYRALSVDFKTWRSDVGIVYHKTLKNGVEKCLKNNPDNHKIVSICEELLDAGEDFMNQAGAITSSVDGYCMMFFKKETTDCDVVHECMHVTSMTMRYKGMDLTPESEEAYCYFIGRLSKKALKFIRKARR